MCPVMCPVMRPVMRPVMHTPPAPARCGMEMTPKAGWWLRFKLKLQSWLVDARFL